MAYRDDPRGGFGRERFATAVSAEDFEQALTLFDAVAPPEGVAARVTRVLESRVTATLGAPLAITLRPTLHEALAVFFVGARLHGAWRLAADGRAIAYGYGELVTIDPAVTEALRERLMTCGVLGG